MEIVVVADDGDPASVRVFERGKRTFRLDAGGVADSDGTVWAETEDALIAPDGSRLERVREGFTSFWFAWSTFYPHTSIYDGKTSLGFDATNTKPEAWGDLKEQDE